MFWGCFGDAWETPTKIQHASFGTRGNPGNGALWMSQPRIVFLVVVVTVAVVVVFIIVLVVCGVVFAVVVFMLLS